MKALLLFFCVSTLAHADLYRWIDPETGSVKLSSLPPSDPSINAEVVPYKAPPLPNVQELQTRWSDLLTRLTGMSQQDFDRGGQGLRQQIAAYQALSAELDRIDPAGAARRRNESTSLVERLKRK